MSAERVERVAVVRAALAARAEPVDWILEGCGPVVSATRAPGGGRRATVWALAGGRVAPAREFADAAEATAAAGLPAGTDAYLDRLAAGFAAMNTGDYAAALELMPAQVEWHPPLDFPGASVQFGREAVRSFWEEFREAWGDWQLDPRGYYLATSTTVVVEATSRVRGQASGLPFETTTWMAWTIAGADALCVRAYRTLDAALAAAG